MLTAGLPAVEQICACDEGVMGFHNDRRTDTKMPTNDSSEVTFTKKRFHIVYSVHVIETGELFWF